MKRFFLFLDESGDHGLRNLDPSFPVFIICGVLFEDNHYTVSRNRINVLKNTIWGNKEVVFHSSDIRRSNKEFSCLLDLNVKKMFMDSLSDIIGTSNYVVFASGIKKEPFIEKFGKLHTNIYEICLSFIIERMVFYLDKIAGEKKVDIIIERRGHKEDKKLSDNFNRLMQVGTGFVTPNRLSEIGLRINFRSKKENINGLQLADLVAYPIARYVLEPNRANPAYDVVSPKIYKNGNKLYGLKISP